jgi:hypothetical protein
MPSRQHIKMSRGPRLRGLVSIGSQNVPNPSGTPGHSYLLDLEVSTPAVDRDLAAWRSRT